jgi:hypothetical protein
MSQPRSSIGLPGVVDSVVREITGALTRRRSMAEPRRRSVARMVSAMVPGLFPGDVMQLMLAGQAVLFHALTIDGAGAVEREGEARWNARNRSFAANLSRTMTGNLDALARSLASSAEDALTRGAGRARDRHDPGEALSLSTRDGDADGPCEPVVDVEGHDAAGGGFVDLMGNPSEDFAEAVEADLAERILAEAMSRQPFAGDTVPETPAAAAYAAPVVNRQQRWRWEREQGKLARRTAGVVNEGRQ